MVILSIIIVAATGLVVQQCAGNLASFKTKRLGRLKTLFLSHVTYKLQKDGTLPELVMAVEVTREKRHEHCYMKLSELSAEKVRYEIYCEGKIIPLTMELEDGQ